MMQLGQQGVNAGNDYGLSARVTQSSQSLVGGCTTVRDPRAGERLQEMNQRLADHIGRLQGLTDRIRGSRPTPISGDASGAVNGTVPLMQSIEYAVGHVSHIGGLLDDLEALI